VGGRYGQALILLAAGALLGAPKKVLYVTHSAGFVHGSITISKRVIDDVGRRNGLFDVVSTEDLSFLSAERLREFDAVFFFTSGELPLSDAQKRALLDFVRAGGGFGGVHSATDTLYQWAEYGELIGAYFDGHPWVHEATVDVEDPGHPATRGLGTSFRFTEEFYQFRSFSRDRVRVLLTLDPKTINLAAEGVNRRDEDFAVAWCRPFGQGRSFYTALGHFDETWLDPRFQNLLEGAFRWILKEDNAAGEPRRSTPRVTQITNLAADAGSTLAPGLLVSITGQGLTTGSSMAAPSLPLPAKLAGTMVRVNGQAAGLISVTPERVVAQIPNNVEGNASIVVVAGSVDAGAPQVMPVEPVAPGILAAVLVEQSVVVYATGLGGPPVEVLVNGQGGEVFFQGPLAGTVGIVQINAVLPAGSAEPLRIRLRSGGKESNEITAIP